MNELKPWRINALLAHAFTLLLMLLAPSVNAATAAAVPGCTTGVIAAKAGPVCGNLLSTSSGKQANAFLGMPFAESTAGDNRWKPPLAKQPWTRTMAASKFGPVCPQFAHHQNVKTLADTQNYPQSEECLSINVWTPASAQADAKLPVMVFIYGGSFVAGYSSDPMYDGAYLAANKNVILVSFNYRLGVLGFLATDELSGNFGFMDQQLALTWVQKNIRDFGGDPARVTLFGESAGSMSVGLHLFSAPASAPLFRAAIMESNFFALPYKSLPEQKNVGNIFMQGLNCRDLACLKKTSVNTLLLAQNAFTPDMSTVFSGAKYYIPFSPAIDGVLLTREPVVAAAAGQVRKPILIGTNKDEALLFTESESITPAGYSAWAAGLYGKEFQRAIARYPAKKDSKNIEVWARIQTDNFLICSTRDVAAKVGAAKVRSPVYAYLFNHQLSFKVWGGELCQSDGNVCHGAELPFVFHSADKIGAQFTADEEKLSNTVIDYWTNFARHLDPNGVSPTSGAAVKWPKFSDKAKDYLVLNIPQASVQNDPYRETCDFWDSIGYNLIEPWKN